MYIYGQNVNIDIIMNNKVTINPGLIMKYDFKHIFTYRLLYYIMIYYNPKVGKILLNKAELVSNYGRCSYSVVKAIEELEEDNIITSCDDCIDYYSINENIFIDFINDIKK